MQYSKDETHFSAWNLHISEYGTQSSVEETNFWIRNSLLTLSIKLISGSETHFEYEMQSPKDENAYSNGNL